MSTIFEDLQEAGDAHLRNIMTPRNVKARMAIAQDDRPPGLHVISSGWAALVRYLPDGKAQYVATYLPGDMVGARALILDRRSEELVALTPCEVLSADAEDIWRAVDNDPSVTFRLMWLAAEEARRLSGLVVALGCGGAAERMALMMMDLRARMIVSGGIPADSSEIPFPLTQQVVGEALGLTPVHVNRVLKRMREDDLLSINAGRARLAVRALAALAAPLLDAHDRRLPEYALI